MVKRPYVRNLGKEKRERELERERETREMRENGVESPVLFFSRRPKYARA